MTFQERYGRTIWQEIVKQCIDQPLHLLWAWAGIAILLWLWPTMWGPIGILFGVVNTAYIAYREYDQWPSTRWWDPYLDWLFFAAGIVVALCVYPGVG
jgi:predicted PurR-regulated permease PerM